MLTIDLGRAIHEDRIRDIEARLRVRRLLDDQIADERPTGSTLPTAPTALVEPSWSVACRDLERGQEAGAA